MKRTYQYRRINTATTTVVKSGQGVFGGVTVNTVGTGDTLTVYDNTSATGTIIAIISPSNTAKVFHYDVQVKNGITIVSAGTPGDYTVLWA